MSPIRNRYRRYEKKEEDFYSFILLEGNYFQRKANRRGFEISYCGFAIGIKFQDRLFLLEGKHNHCLGSKEKETECRARADGGVSSFYWDLTCDDFC